MTGRATSIVLAAALASGVEASAAGPDRPLFEPARDVAVVYRPASDTPTGGAMPPQPDITFAWSTRLGRMRIDPGGDHYVIIDRRADRAYVVYRARRIYLVETARTPATPDFLMNENATFRRTGEAAVSGLPCTVWQIDSAGWISVACVTADGVLLRHDREFGVGGTSSVAAVSVVYAEQPAALFEPPANFRGANMVPPRGR